MAPNTDGIDHINIYSKAKTNLGMYLSNFTKSTILTVDGNFTSIEGYWLGSRNDVLRELYGFRAKQIGKTLPRICVLTNEEFQLKIRDACWIKIHSVPQYLNEFTNSVLPFEHYYAYGDKVIDAGFKWLIDMWTQYREFIKNGYIA